MGSNEVVTIDGARGTGKSQLAHSLRDHFGCGVLEIGPLFRLISWLTSNGYTSSPIEAGWFIEKAIDTKEVDIRLDKPCAFSACCIYVQGNMLDQELWDPLLDNSLKAIASNEEVILMVSRIAHKVASQGKVVAVGREVGVKVFPNANIKIVLEAEDVTRRKRKLLQLTDRWAMSTEDYSLDSSEPEMLWLHGENSVRINTSNLSAEATLRQASKCITQYLGWQPLI